VKAVKKHTNCPWVLFYIERWLQEIRRERRGRNLTSRPTIIDMSDSDATMRQRRISADAVAYLLTCTPRGAF